MGCTTRRGGWRVLAGSLHRNSSRPRSASFVWAAHGGRTGPGRPGPGRPGNPRNSPVSGPPGPRSSSTHRSAPARRTNGSFSRRETRRGCGTAGRRWRRARRPGMAIQGRAVVVAVERLGRIHASTDAANQWHVGIRSGCASQGSLGGTLGPGNGTGISEGDAVPVSWGDTTINVPSLASLEKTDRPACRRWRPGRGGPRDALAHLGLVEPFAVRAAGRIDLG